MTVTIRLVRAAPAVLLTFAWLAAAVPVAADAELEATFPQAGATVDTPPGRVAARFSEALGADSFIELFDPDGESVARGGVDPDDPRRLILEAPAELGAGEYEARWNAFSADGHLVRGAFTFTVAASATAEPSASAAPSASRSAPSAEPTDAPLPSPSAAAAPAPASGSDVVIPIVAAVLVVGGLGMWLLRGRRSRA